MGDTIETVRTRLAMRESFFGGPISTREMSMAPRYKNFKRVTQPPKKPTNNSRQGKTQKHPIGKKLTRDTKLTNDDSFRKARRRAAGDFSGLNDTVCSAPPLKKQKTSPSLPPSTIPRRNTILTANRDQQQQPKVVNVMKIKHRTTALGMQSLQLITRKGKPATPQKPSPQRQPTTNTNTISPHSSGRTRRRSSASPNTKKRSNIATKLQFNGTFYGAHQPPAALYKRRSLFDDEETDDDSLLSDFIDDGDEDDDVTGGAASKDTTTNTTKNKKKKKKNKRARQDGDDNDDEEEEEWRAELREALGGYDAGRYAAVDQLPDRRMEAGWDEIVEEEVQAARIAKAIDRREALLEAQRKKKEDAEDREEEKLRRREKLRLIEEDDSEEDDDFIIDDDDE